MDDFYVFLDTSILYKDPFFKGNFSSKLLEIAKKKNVDIYLSRIVLDELVRNYEKIINEENSKLSKIISDSNHYNFVNKIKKLFDVEFSLKELKVFYDNLYNEGIIYIIDHDDDMLSEIINRAVNRKKPFSENKNELKDALTWLSYSKFVEHFELSNCILITDNVRDFCDLEKLKKDELVIHDDLLNDTKRFRIYRSIKDFLQKEDDKLNVSSVRFLQWMNYQDFNDIFIINILRNDLGDDVKKSVKDKFSYYNLNYIFGANYSVEGFLTFDNRFFLHKVENIEVDAFAEECIISGDLFISCSVQAYEYNDGISNADDNYRYLNMSSGNDFRLFGEKELYIKVSFSFYYDKNESPFNLSVDSIDLN